MANPRPSTDLTLHGGTLRRSLAERDANVIPLIDIVFILILYFMLAGNLDVRMLEALSAPASTSTRKPPSAGVAIVVKAGGEVWLGGAPLSDEALVERLAAGIALSDRVILLPDARADAARVADIIALLARANVESVALITKPKSRS